MILGWQHPGKVGQCGGFSFFYSSWCVASKMLKLLLREPLAQKTTTHAITFQALQCRHAGVAQLVEHYLAKVDVASSNLVSRSNSGLILSGGAFSFGL